MTGPVTGSAEAWRTFGQGVLCLRRVEVGPSRPVLSVVGPDKGTLVEEEGLGGGLLVRPGGVHRCLRETQGPPPESEAQGLDAHRAQGNRVNASVARVMGQAEGGVEVVLGQARVAGVRCHDGQHVDELRRP
ncbi:MULTISPECIES: hypothetical protein [Streptomyces]|uniref:hypothetical protein n=1 Tax=Streptomyces TaxID=1883 RepID=UPI002054AB15|nr:MULTISPECIES: hypothetical protein [Streptomyces]UPT46461.1 hypothetical protein MWG59_36850 [Streptomyces sp. WAC00303]WIY80584.1 hypothetical protein QPM16_36490 [Streptomyces anulatus]